MSDLATAYSFPEDRGSCGFCGKEENGYAKRDDSGNWLSACWPCVKPENAGASQQKRTPVGTTFTEDLDAEDRVVKKPKAIGIAPASRRPKVL